MAPFKTYKSLVQLRHKEGTLFEVVGDSSTLPEWFYPEHLDDPKALYVNAWLVEAIFGKDGEYIPHVEWTSRTLLKVTQWLPEEDAEILIFGPPYYQKDVSQMISNLVNYFCSRRMQEEAHSQEAETQCFPVHEAARRLSPVGKVLEAATQLSLVEVHDAASQQAPVEVTDAATQLSPVEVHDAATQLAPVEVAEAATQLAPVEAAEAATQLFPVEVVEAATQVFPVEAAEAATQLFPVEVAEAATQLAPVEVAEAATQLALMQVGDATKQLAPMQVGNATKQLAPVTVSEAATQQAHVEASEAATEHTSGAVHRDVIQEAATL